MTVLSERFPADAALVYDGSSCTAINGVSQHLLCRWGSVVIVAPHPDDETLGCGGLIAACADLKIPITIVSVTNGEGSHPGSKEWSRRRLARVRCMEQLQALQVLGTDPPSVVRLNLPDGQVSLQSTAALDHARDALLRLVRSGGSSAVFVTAPDDDHPDHQACARLVMSIERQVNDLQVFHYAVWPPKATDNVGVSTGRDEQWVLDIRPALERKARAIACHRSQRGLVVTDDPEGFCMPSSLLERALLAQETFVRANVPC